MRLASMMLIMATQIQKTKKALQDLEDIGKVLKGMLDEARIQAHLAAMELKDDAGPFLREVNSASRAAARDLGKRGRQLKTQLAKLRTVHRGARRSR
jgi:hypothetical protein